MRIEHLTHTLLRLMLLIAVLLHPGLLQACYPGIGLGMAIGPLLLYAGERDKRAIGAWCRGALMTLCHDTCCYVGALGVFLLWVAHQSPSPTSPLHLSDVRTFVVYSVSLFCWFLALSVPMGAWFSAGKVRQVSSVAH